MKMFSLVKSSLLVCGAAAIASSPVTAGSMNATWSVNGHEYMLVEGSSTWEQASSSLGTDWYLATITSAAEQSFIADTFSQYRGEFWLGGYQSEAGLSAAERKQQAAENWAWVTGEDWNSFDNWKSGEPNEWAGKLENHLAIWNNGGSWNWHWNDEHGKANIRGYIAEKGSVSVSEPGSLALLGLGLLGLASSRKKFKK